MTRQITIGQFSQSPVLAAAHHLGLLAGAGLEVHVERVPSSPGQFEWLRDGTIDVAITSPDNVLLYATTENNPIGTKLDLRMLRAIDRGLGLSLVTRPEVDLTSIEVPVRMGVDVLRSGFAFLLRSMLTSLDVAPHDLDFVEVGSTPKRMGLLLAGDIDGTILNAESMVEAVAAGMRAWLTSADVSKNYLGTVIAVGTDFDQELADDFLTVWAEATNWLLIAPQTEVAEMLAAVDPRLGTSAYLDVLRDPHTGLLANPTITVQDLQILCDIRAAAGAYFPSSEEIGRLISA